MSVISVAEYISALNKTGTRTIPGSERTFWISYERGAMVRMPTFSLDSPAPGEVKQVLWNGRVAVASYVLKPDRDHPPNAWLYTSGDSDYCVEKLSKPAQRCVRRALRSLQIAELELPTLLKHGFLAYQDTCTRIGLASDSLEQFQKGIAVFFQNPAHRVIGAWQGNTLVAFMMLVVVDDWLEIPASFSSVGHLDSRPNDGLVNFVLQHFLVERGYAVVSYGLSSIEEGADLAGLHAFKTKVGFEARPVHRVFVIHPLLRPFANRLALWGTRAALRMYPEGRLLRKARGVLANLLSRPIEEEIASIR
jgi:hypothetical protein